MTFWRKAPFPIWLFVVLYAPTFLVEQKGVIVAVGFALGLVLAAVAVGSTGFRTALSGGERGAKTYLMLAFAFAGFAGFVTFFANAHLGELHQRPMAFAQVSMMPSVMWGGAAGFLVAAILTWLRRRPA